MGRANSSGDGSHGGAETRRADQFLIGVISAISATFVISATSQAQAPPACHWRAADVIAARERAAAEWPKALLPQIELAACYDKAWRFQDVEPAIAKAVAILDAEIRPPVKTKDVRPSYPPGALSSRTQGTVLIEALLDTSGKVGRAEIRSKPSVLDAAALNAVLKWEFQPATRNGAPIATAMTSTVSFRLGR